MSESRLFANITEAEQLADTVTENEQDQQTGDAVTDTQPIEDVAGRKKQRKKRNQHSDDMGLTADTSVSPDNTSITKSDATSAAEESVPEKQYKTGDPIDIRLALLYSSSAAPKHFTGIKGRYYIWDDTTVNGRVRLTDSPSGVGKPERIIGWVKLNNIQ